ncbi:MAG: DUF342 domain-containing protein [Planctomycetes bacterium]|nr:DUF342 domain-containing protein [Planctomycetota bacterium]
MPSTPDSSPGRLTVELARGGLEAWLTCRRVEGATPPTMDDVLEALERAEVAVDDNVLKKVQEFLAQAGAKDRLPERFLMAEGRAPREAGEGRIEWHPAIVEVHREWLGEAPAAPPVTTSILPVEAGARLGTITAGTPGAEGVDVRGRVLAPSQLSGDIAFDDSVRRDDTDPSQIVAGVAGRAVLEGRRLSVRAVHTVPADVGVDSDQVNVGIDAHVAGTIHDGMSVRSAESISIGRTVEAARVEAGGDVFVCGGIVQRGKGVVRAGRDVAAKFCRDAELHSGRDIRVANELTNCRIRCMGRLLIPQGTIIGGQVYAREAIEAATVGSDANVPTELMIGVLPEVLDRVERLQKERELKRALIDRVRQSVGPLLANQRRLTPSQKERATEMMFQADAAEAELGAMDAECQRLLQAAAPTGTPQVTVKRMLHPHAALSQGRRRAVVTRPLRGPLRIEQRQIRGVAEFVCINLVTRSVTVLPSTQTTPSASGSPTESLLVGAAASHG